MNLKSLMVLHQAQEPLDRFVSLGESYNLVLIHDPSDALSFLKRIPVDVIMIHDEMSGMDALEFLMNLQDLHLTAYTVVLYNDHVPMDIPEMTNVSFLKEPVHSDELRRFISQLGTARQTQKIS